MMRGKLQAIFDSALASFAALVLASSFAPTTHAQARDARTATPSSATRPAPTTQTRDAQTPRAEESAAEPDVSITARVTADSLRFERVPNPKVEFDGRPRRETVWESERQNLPQQVQPGITYRDVGITLRITSVFADIDRIVAEALGEVPASDDAQPTPPTQPAPAQPGAQTPATPASQESRAEPTPSPSKPPTRASARGRAGRRGRGL